MITRHCWSVTAIVVCLLVVDEQRLHFFDSDTDAGRQWMALQEKKIATGRKALPPNLDAAIAARGDEVLVDVQQISDRIVVRAVRRLVLDDAVVRLLQVARARVHLLHHQVMATAE